jgi:tRNA (guanosine-2'-O-)-methyltransferase
MSTKERIHKVKKVLSGRFADLRVVMEDVKNTHNASAVVRTCDAAGVLFLDVISSEDQPFPVNEAISTRAEKWLQLTSYTDTENCLTELKKKGFSIASTYLGEETIPYTDFDFTKPTAIVFGNEAEGISLKAREMADYTIHIPMVGMVRSLNLSVSVGIILYEAIRQRLASPTYMAKGLSSEELESMARSWLGMD